MLVAAVQLLVAIIYYVGYAIFAVLFTFCASALFLFIALTLLMVYTIVSLGGR